MIREIPHSNSDRIQRTTFQISGPKKRDDASSQSVSQSASQSLVFTQRLSTELFSTIL